MITIWSASCPLQQSELHDTPDAHAARLKLHQLWSALHQTEKRDPQQPTQSPPPTPTMRDSRPSVQPTPPLVSSPARLAPPATKEQKKTKQAVPPPWRAPIARYVEGYVLHRPHVSANCRLSVGEELSLLSFCFDDENQRSQLGQERLMRDHLYLLQTIHDLPESKRLVLNACHSVPRPLTTARWFDLIVRPDQLLLAHDDASSPGTLHVARQMSPEEIQKSHEDPRLRNPKLAYYMRPMSNRSQVQISTAQHIAARYRIAQGSCSAVYCRKCYCSKCS